ncbi:MAG: Holliday junction resolvase Hjc [Nanoarchaeota archaeon]|nr:Holliday junction resolvase Hjc [Nanoarchaeota archaeon]
MSKKKGTRAERELFHLLWNAKWSVVRSAGSGSSRQPSPDLITSDGKRVLAIECKALKSRVKYFNKEEIAQLAEFSIGFGAEPWIGIRFDQEGWYFMHINDIPLSRGSTYCLSFDFVQKKGLKFEELIGKFKQKRLSP